MDVRQAKEALQKAVEAHAKAALKRGARLIRTEKGLPHGVRQIKWWVASLHGRAQGMVVIDGLEAARQLLASQDYVERVGKLLVLTRGLHIIRP